MIRTATTGDIDTLLALLEQLFAIEEDFYFAADKQRRGLELLLASPGASVVVATEEELVVGMATGQLLISTAEGAPAILVEDVVVTPAYRGHGHGKRLLEALGQWGQERGAERMQLLADIDNAPAFDFYLGQNWSRTNLICLRKYYRGAHT